MGDKQPSTIKELCKALADMAEKFQRGQAELKADLTKVFETELGAVKRGMDFINKMFEEFKTEIADVKKELADARAEQQAVRTETCRLIKELNETKMELIDMQQYSRRVNLEIKGIPEVQNEDLLATTTAISASLKVPIKESDIDVVHRVPTKDKTKSNIIVKFTSRAARDKVLKEAKKLRLNTSHLGLPGTEPIYINEHLCPAKKVLLGCALKAKRDKNWKFTWVSDGKILMRRTDNSRAVHIACMDDLAQVV